MAYIDLRKHSTPVQRAAHAIGLDHKRPYTRHGKTFYRPYRNYFTTHDRAPDFTIWMQMYVYGYAGYTITEKAGGIKFWLTRKGLDWLGETLGITIYDEEE